MIVSRHAIRLSLALLASCMSQDRVVAQVGPVTAGATIEAMRGTLNGVIDRARVAGQILLVDAALHVNGMLDRIERLLGDNIRRPLDQIDSSIRNELDATRFLMSSVVETANQLPACIGNEADIVLANLKGGVQSVLSALPFTTGHPIGFLVQASTSRAPYTVVRDQNLPAEISLTLRGANLWMPDEVCRVTAEAIPFSTSQPRTTLSVKSYDSEKVILGLPPSVAEGEFVLSVTAKRKRWRIGGCMWPTEQAVAVGMRVVAPTTASVTVTITPTCAGHSICVRAIENSCTNGSEREDKNCVHTFEFDDADCEYDSISGWETGGRDGTVYRPQRVGSNVVVQSTANRRPRFGGGTSRVWFRGTMVGRKRAAPVIHPQIRIALPRVLAPGHSVGFDMSWTAPSDCVAQTFVLGGEATFNDGRPVALAERTISAELDGATSGSGIRTTFNGLTRRGTVELSSNSCLAR